jgi:hypothetical protein
LQAFQRRRRLATLTKAVAAYALESVKVLEERSPMGLEATAETEGVAVVFAIGRLGVYCVPLSYAICNGRYVKDNCFNETAPCP